MMRMCMRTYMMLMCMRTRTCACTCTCTCDMCMHMCTCACACACAYVHCIGITHMHAHACALREIEYSLGGMYCTSGRFQSSEFILHIRRSAKPVDLTTLLCQFPSNFMLEPYGFAPPERASGGGPSCNSIWTRGAHEYKDVPLALRTEAGCRPTQKLTSTHITSILVHIAIN